jgi:superfamily I DNA/RNA helicase
MADANSLSELKTKWQIPDRSLDKSFRCNDQIAAAVRSLGTNPAFEGRGNPGGTYRRSFIFRETSGDFSESIAAFRKLLALAQIPDQESAIICRGNDQLQSVRGQVNYAKLKGNTKRLAESAFYRDCRRDYKAAFAGVEEVLRELIWDDEEWARLDDAPDSPVAEKVRETLWKFVKSDKGLPSVSLNGDAWVATMKDRLIALTRELGAPPVENLGMKIRTHGLDQEQLLLPLFEEQKLFPNIRHETIHQVKGESIGAVLVIGGVTFWNSVIKAIGAEENNEDRRLAYVAMTRAKDLVMLSTPAGHFDKHVPQWKGWDFQPFS